MIIVRINSPAYRFWSAVIPRWMPFAIEHVRVGRDCTTFAKVYYTGRWFDNGHFVQDHIPH